MNKIVVGYDGTDQAKDALYLGAAVARAVDAQLLVASAIEFGPFDSAGSIEIGAGYIEASAKHFEQIFDQARGELGDFDFEPRPLQDTAAHGLTELAESEDVDLIVVGSTHHGPIRRVLAGTVATRLLHGAPCAVMVAPRGWSSRRHASLGPIGVGYDGLEESMVALSHAQELAAAFGAVLRVITIAPYVGVNAHLDDIEVMRAVWAERLEQAVSSVSDEVETERVLRQGREATELALQGADLGLLVIGSRAYGPLRRALVGSVSAELVRTAPCPILVVPRGAEARSSADVEPMAATA